MSLNFELKILICCCLLKNNLKTAQKRHKKGLKNERCIYEFYATKA